MNFSEPVADVDDGQLARLVLQRDALERAYRSRRQAAQFLLVHLLVVVVSVPLSFVRINLFPTDDVTLGLSGFFFLYWLFSPVVFVVLAVVWWRRHRAFVSAGGRAGWYRLAAVRYSDFSPQTDRFGVPLVDGSHSGGVGYGAAASPEVYRELAELAKQMLAADAQRAFKSRNRFIGALAVIYGFVVYGFSVLIALPLPGLLWLLLLFTLASAPLAFVGVLVAVAFRQLHYLYLGGDDARGLSADESFAEAARFRRVVRLAIAAAVSPVLFAVISGLLTGSDSRLTFTFIFAAMLVALSGKVLKPVLSFAFWHAEVRYRAAAEKKKSPG